jgi:1-acyl-sn-glycerol-3-phosphate acyltransferase
MGLKLEVRGDLSLARPTLFISNHISYTDIFVLGGIAPGNFIAKSEVAGWPVLGNLARIQDTLFFERKGRHARSQVNVMRTHMTNGGNLILFPEGTSTEGTHVEPFKSSLFSATDLESKQQALIQPVTISYTRYQGEPMSQDIREYYAWYGTTPFSPHFFEMLGMHSARVELIFHPPVKLNEFESRKSCAEYCQQLISKSLTATLDVNEDEDNINEFVNQKTNNVVK